ncbi:MAG: hypothetical protein IPP08_04220 [Chlorobiota bacterium]|nr:hypothetical protein [Chlorobiota bacterium]QQS67377.1 MAG: hypothetical protein IPP08_04220 [Chlorobiota bacterium]
MWVLSCSPDTAPSNYFLHQNIRESKIKYGNPIGKYLPYIFEDVAGYIESH